MNTLDERARIVRCRACGRIWESQSASPRCSNHRCRSTQIREIGYREIKRMIEDLENFAEKYTPDEERYIKIVADDDWKKYRSGGVTND